MANPRDTGTAADKTADTRSEARCAYEDLGCGFKRIAKLFPSRTADEWKATCRAEGWRRFRSPHTTGDSLSPEEALEPAPPQKRGHLRPRRPRVEAIRSLRGQVASESGIADALGIDWHTLDKYRKESKAIAAAIDYVCEGPEVLAENGLMHHLRTRSEQMIRWYLSTRPRYRTQHEVTGKDGGPVVVAAVLPSVLAEILGMPASTDVPAAPTSEAPAGPAKPGTGAA